MLEEKITMPPVFQKLDDEDIANILWNGYSKKDWTKDYSKDPDVVKFRKHIMGKTEWNTYDEVKKAVSDFIANDIIENDIASAKKGFKKDYSAKEIDAIRKKMQTTPNVSGNLSQDALLYMNGIRGRFFVFTLARQEFKNVKFSSLAITDGEKVFVYPLAAIKNGVRTMIKNDGDEPAVKVFPIKTWRFMVNNPKRFQFSSIYFVSQRTSIPEAGEPSDERKEFTQRFVKDF